MISICEIWKLVRGERERNLPSAASDHPGVAQKKTTPMNLPVPNEAATFDLVLKLKEVPPPLSGSSWLATQWQ